MRAIFGCVLVLVCGAAACGGEVIDYSKSPTPTVTPDVILRLVPLRERVSQALVQDHSRIAGNELEVDRELELEEDLYSWAQRVRKGSASRAELLNVCSVEAPQVVDYDGLDPAAICFMVNTRPYSRTLREWADLIESSFDQYHLDPLRSDDSE